MPIAARYAHTNLVARDWRAVAKFYEEVFGCVFLPPERDHHGGWVEAVTGVVGARVRGGHLRLPGHGDEGPTLEIFEYNRTVDGARPAVNRPGLAHLAFEVEDVEAARREVVGAGGGDYGKTATVNVPGKGTLTLVYMTDPEGNIVELQRWSA